jgi:hypothetical protein
MKLRIKGNSLRLRVSRSELTRFLSPSRIEETIHFAPGSEAKLTYALESAPLNTEATVRYIPHELTVTISEEQARIWSEAREVGIYTTVDIGAEGLLEVIIEKDFACIDRSDEDNTDTFVNPNVSAVC